MNRSPSLTLIDALPESWIERMFDKMMLDYGKKFVDQWSGADPEKLIAHWAVEMASYTGQEIKHGLAAMANQDWPPTLPMFKKLCRPPVDSVHAYYEALAGVTARAKGEGGTWSHPAIYWAATALSFDLQQQTFSQMKSRWEKTLADEMEKGEWPAIPAPMLALVAPSKGDLSREKAGEMLRQLGASKVLSTTGRDQKRWATKLIERKAAGEDISPVFVKWANEALGNESTA